MTSAAYLQGQATPNLDFGTGFNSYEWANNFTVNDDGYLKSLAWYRGATGTGWTPQYLRIWRRDTASLVYAATSMPDDGQIGWQRHNLTTNVALSAGVTYSISIGMPNAYRWAYQTPFSGSPPSQFTRPATNTEAVTGGGYGYPSSASTNSRYFGIDCEWTDIPPGGGGGTGDPTLTGDLAAWLSTDTDYQQHQADGLPWLTRAELADVQSDITSLDSTAGDIKAETDLIGALADAASATGSVFARTAELLARSAELLTRIPSTFATGWSQLFGGWFGGAGPAPGAPTLPEYAAATDASVQLLTALARNALATFPGTPWVQTDETTFDTSLAWPVEADLYVVSFTSLGGSIVNTVADGVDVSYRLAWWCPLIGAFGQQRRFLDFPDAHLWLDGQRLPGLLLHSPVGATGSVQAWTYA